MSQRESNQDALLNKAFQMLLHGELVDDESQPTNALLVVGAPNSGKTTFALHCFKEAGNTIVPENIVLAVHSRTVAQQMSDRLIQSFGVLAQARPATTLSALAFRILTRYQQLQKAVRPKLLNGAQQDEALRQIVSTHCIHVELGQSCDVCMLLGQYFASAQWVTTISNSIRNVDGVTVRDIDDEFIRQLRDTIARFDELGIDDVTQQQLMRTIMPVTPNTASLNVKWQLAFALRDEYRNYIQEQYKGQWWLDSSQLLSQAANAICNSNSAELLLPELVICDDVQDITLSGLRLLEALSQAGTKLVLIGCPDESVQMFRGAYPEITMQTLHDGPVKVRVITLQPTYRQKPTQLDIVRSRVSWSIPAVENNQPSQNARLGKLPMYEGMTLSVPSKESSQEQKESSTLNKESNSAEKETESLKAESDAHKKQDTSLNVAFVHTEEQEIRYVLNAIKQATIKGIDYNRMMVIAHDNATVASFGQALRREGIPVQYTQANAPLRQDSNVQALFALIELAQMAQRGIRTYNSTRDLQSLAYGIRTRIATILQSPLANLHSDKVNIEYPARLHSVEVALQCLGNLVELAKEANESVLPEEALQVFESYWNEFENEYKNQLSEQQSNTVIDDSLLDENVIRLDQVLVQAYCIAIFGETLKASETIDEDSQQQLDQQSLTPIASIKAILRAICGDNIHVKTFIHVLNMVQKLAKKLETGPAQEASQIIDCAWQVTGVEEAWQKQALLHNDIGRNANDRLDTIIRLFDYIAGLPSNNINECIAHIRNMRLQADSLSVVAPMQHAVTVTTPAGAMGRNVDYVWIVRLQQNTWPNLAPRDTLFATQTAANVILRGLDPHSDIADRFEHEQSLVSTLAAEIAMFLVSLTRAEHCTLSAVWNQEQSPSEFLRGFTPELISDELEKQQFVQDNSSDYFVDFSPRTLVGLARARLANNQSVEDELDAVQALLALKNLQVESANTETWQFVDPSCGQVSAKLVEAVEKNKNGTQSQAAQNVENSESKGQKVASTHNKPSVSTHDESDNHSDSVFVSLSPSSVDELWGCPICWLLNKRCSGPTVSTFGASFGSLVHDIAERANKQNIDTSDIQATTSELTSQLIDMYLADRIAPESLSSAKQQFTAMQKDDQAQAVFERMARYFKESANPDYLGKNNKKFTLGTPVQVESELEIDADLTFEDILQAVNTTPGVRVPFTFDELIACMGALVGGWPDGLDSQLRIHLNGRIDRAEIRTDNQGNRSVHLLDWKTGKSDNAPKSFMDLQLVCYQLGLAYENTSNNEQNSEGLQVFAHAGRDGLPIETAALFYIADKDVPAEYYSAAFGDFQPALLINGHLNNDSFKERDHVKAISTFAKEIVVPERPEGIRDEVWMQVLEFTSTQALWSLTMISRVFYAAAASRSNTLIVTPHGRHTNSRSCQYAKGVCPACSKGIETVYEVRSEYE